MEIEDRVAIACDLGGVGLAMKHAQRAAIALRRLDRELASDEGEEVRRQRRRLGKLEGRGRLCAAGSIAYPLPSVRDGQRERVARLQVGLFEAWECQPRPRWHEQGVQKVVVAIQCLVAG